LNQEARNELVELAYAKMHYGRFAGRFLVDLPEEYIIWYRNKGFPPGKLGRQLEQILELKVNGLEYLLRNIRK
jgi:uncharacterized protein (DUF3820 family)